MSLLAIFWKLDRALYHMYAKICTFPSIAKSPISGDFQFIDVPECLSSWQIQGGGLEIGHFLYFAAVFRGIMVYAVKLKVRDRAYCSLIV